MQIKKAEIEKVFEKLKLDVRSTTHRYGWFNYEGKKYCVSIFRMGKAMFREE